MHRQQLRPKILESADDVEYDAVIDTVEPEWYESFIQFEYQNC